MTDRICSIDGCNGPHDSRGFCGRHRAYFSYHGIPLPPKRTMAERFWSKVDKSAGCWIWTAHIDAGGYGRIGVDGRIALAHRVAFELIVGPIGDLCIDHMCHNTDPDCPGGPACMHRRCVNPSHLVPSTTAENAQRSPLKGSKTHCKHGHLFDDANTAYHAATGKRWCRTCDRIRKKVAH